MCQERVRGTLSDHGLARRFDRMAISIIAYK
jgi:hypothetical protein